MKTLIAASCIAVLPLAAAAQSDKEAQCRTLAQAAGKAAALKSGGTAVEAAITEIEGAHADAGAIADRLGPAVRFAYMAGMSAGDTEAFYLAQCMKD